MPFEDEPLEESVYDTPGVRPYDPETVQPTSTGPAPSSTAPGFGGTSGNDSVQAEQATPGEQGQQEQQDQQEPVPEFDPRWTEEFRGLLYIGALTDTFVWLGHTFTIRTLTTAELAEASLAIKPYVGTDMALKAYQSAVVAAALVSVDGQALPSPITLDVGDTPFLNRFRYVFERYFPPVIDALYERYYALEIKVREVLDAMGKVSG